MRVRTVRRVATFFRLPWWISMEMVLGLGTAKLTAKWLRSLTSLPIPSSQINLSCVLCNRNLEFKAPMIRLTGSWCFVPRGPSTVTIRDLMATLTKCADESAMRVPIACEDVPNHRQPVSRIWRLYVRHTRAPTTRNHANRICPGKKKMGGRNVPPSGISRSSWE
jgi:hypothetical protein